MTEKELYERVVVLREETDKLIDGALAMPATIELCVFTGKLGAALDVLVSLEDAGVPVRDPDEELHPLELGPEGEPFPVVHLGNTESDTVPPKWCVGSREKDARGGRDVIGLFHDEAAARWFAERWRG